MYLIRSRVGTRICDDAGKQQIPSLLRFGRSDKGEVKIWWYHALRFAQDWAPGMKTFSIGRCPAGPAEFIVRNMDRAITMRAHVVVWLLCAVLTGLAIHSPHCDRCDSPYFFTSSLPQRPVANHPLPSAPDNCTGICWCCGFHWLPNASPVLTLANNVTIGVWPEPASPVLAPRSPIFRPPRTAISS
jgi:hypothetical protein